MRNELYRVKASGAWVLERPRSPSIDQGLNNTTRPICEAVPRSQLRSPEACFPMHGLCYTSGA